jgi:hypothetical protein
MQSFDPKKILSKKRLEDNFEISFHKDFIENKSVLGIDIYKYSEYPADIQVYVPVLFNSLYDLTVDNCLKKENYFFQMYETTLVLFKNKFISTGDGGFQIFDDPLQSILFAAYFQLNVQRFNSGSLISIYRDNLFKIVGRIELRYAITYDKIYSYDMNFYGPSIINNARILAKDHLNRMLIDFPSLFWFDKNINTIGNILTMKRDDFAVIEYFKSYETDKTSLLFDQTGPNKIRSVDILKIGVIKSKNTILEIHNLRIQFNLEIPQSRNGYTGFLVTLGNLNTQGIE